MILSGAQTVVQPGAQILAEGGPIVIGEGNLIQEQVTIINKWACHRGVGEQISYRPHFVIEWNSVSSGNLKNVWRLALI